MFFIPKSSAFIEGVMNLFFTRESNVCEILQLILTALHYAAVSPAKQSASSQSPVEEKRVAGCPRYVDDGESV